MPHSEQPTAAPEYDAELIRTRTLPDALYELLSFVRDNPGMVLGRKTLDGLYYWLQGYQVGKCEIGDDDREFAKFDDFVCAQYDWHDAGGWAAKIAYYHRTDADAFDEFFRLLDAFRASRKVE